MTSKKSLQFKEIIIPDNDTQKSYGILERQQTICATNMISSEENNNINNQGYKEEDTVDQQNFESNLWEQQQKDQQHLIQHHKKKNLEKKVRFVLPPKGFRYYHSKEEKEGALFHYQNKDINQLKNPVNIMEKETSCLVNSLVARPSLNRGFLISKSLDNFYKPKQVLIVFNPKAGNNQKRNQQILKQFQQLLQQHNIQIKQTLISKSEQDIEIQFIQNNTLLNKVDTIVSIGGDGTLNDIINGLLKRKQEILNQQQSCFSNPNSAKKNINIEFGSPQMLKNKGKLDKAIEEYQIDSQQPCIAIIPTGTNNHTANNYLNKQQKYEFNYTEIMNNIINHYKPYFMDIMEIIYKNFKFNQFERTYSQQGIYWGLLQKTLQASKNSSFIGKNLKFDINAKINMLKNLSQEVYLKIDDQDQDFKIQTNCLMITNNQFGLSRKKIAPFAQMNDGFLDLVIYDNISKCDTSTYYEEMGRGGSHIYQPNLISGQFKNLQLFTKNPTQIQIDGENKKIMFSPITINVLEKKVKIIY